jgi:acetolactate synthase-1/2/3 large subunit
MTAVIKNLAGGAIVVKRLEQRKICRVFQVPGASFLPVLEGLPSSIRVQAITDRHEASAAFAGEAYGEISGRPAVSGDSSAGGRESGACP